MPTDQPEGSIADPLSRRLPEGATFTVDTAVDELFTVPSNPTLGGVTLDEAISQMSEVLDARFGRQRPPDRGSVMSPYHPANDPNRRLYDGQRRYTYRQRRVRPLPLTLGWEMEANHRPLVTPKGLQELEDGSVNGDAAEYVVLPAIT